MTEVILLGLIGALLTGLAIGTQSTITSRVGSLIGSFRTGVMINLIGGLLAGMTFLVILLAKGKGYWQGVNSVIGLTVIAGAIGILVITGIAFSLQRIGVAAGLSTLIFGQMVISILVDTKGWGGSPPIPISWSRILGLVVIAVGVYLILPKK